ncbi:apolipoprotein N-acyltransferase [Halarcobacter anaerophilus]|jgi:apolipoprotein N-acyltransferase|uniref:Apolipoprotein N-acyltransferase n=1 Tax=Halarcobacter anaerophilus TaxID=877500 RepID=A0A4Q0XYU3_9BACT|nr:apolipoprotein N-acyltransferase [Halarcobacter anaerophilus]QDF28067.1 apolipoprotein N-acyltransferase [Halarcobacter anaerophilus]RXJ62413.1 apolipoprotein N-acyltransferase [Halarcobacter anaerophilus]
MFLVKRDNFNKTYIIKGLITSLFFSAFIYLAHFNIEYKILDTILGLVSLYLVLKIDKKALFVAGYFIGIFWFFWVGNSFEYYNLGYLSFFIPLFFGLGYGIIFFIIGVFDFTFYRAFILFVLSFIHPFGFNWFIPELLFINSFLDTSKISFALILLSLFILIEFPKKTKILAVISLLFTYTNSGQYIENPPNIKISMPQLNISQDQKWLKSNIPDLVENNLKLIDNAIKEKKNLIILPETVFPVVLNKRHELLAKLLKKSHFIDIIAGALYLEEGNYYNATYHISKGEALVAKKVVLVPFGEEIPFPKFLTDFINKIFFDGAEDYKKAASPTDFVINGVKFRNAICYEATSDKIFQNLDGVKYMIAISNNAWFTPSTEPTLQKMLLKYYAKKYNITIFHSVNGSKNTIIRP